MRKSLTVQKKVLAGFGVVVFLFAALSAYLLSNAGSIQRDLELVDGQAIQADKIAPLRADIFELHGIVASAIAGGTAESAADARDAYSEVTSEFQEKLDV